MLFRSASLKHRSHNMNQDLSILHLVLNASFVVQAVMLLLMVVSITSWAAIFRKYFALNRVKSLNEAFEREFAAYVGTKYALCVNSGSSANLLALAALLPLAYVLQPHLQPPLRPPPQSAPTTCPPCCSNTWNADWPPSRPWITSGVCSASCFIW